MVGGCYVQSAKKASEAVGNVALLAGQPGGARGYPQPEPEPEPEPAPGGASAYPEVYRKLSQPQPAPEPEPAPAAQTLKQ
eukprot:COSAG04_NODE_6137_length_1401_cov_1.218894_2_plen_80_part_00